LARRLVSFIHAFTNFGSAVGIRATPALPVSADKGTLLGSAVCRVRPLSALTPSPSPTLWERGAAREPVWSAEALASASGGSSASALHSISLSLASRERGTKGVKGIQPLARPRLRGKNRPCFKDFVPNRCTLIRERAGSGGILHAQEFVNSGSAIGKCLCIRFSICAPLRAGGNHRGLPLHNGVSVGADPRVCPNSHVEIIPRRHLL
jgi:hypothetical protein